MTIETAPAANPAPAKAQQGANSGKAKNGANDAAASGAQGFLALLSAADDALALPVDTTTLTDTAQQEDDTAQQRDADASTLAGWLLGVAPATTADATQPTEGAATTATAKAPGAQRAAWAALDPEAGQAKRTAPAAGSAHKAGQPLATAELQKGVDTSAAAQTTPQATSQLHEEIAKKLQELQAVRTPEPAQTASSVAKEAVAALASAAQGERRMAEPLGAKPVAADPTYFQTQSQASSAPMGMDGVVASQSAAPLESYVAEQVTYWVSQDVQNAELTMDGMGFSPVQVSISMQGNEAQVAFRTDELQARHAIESASQELRDSLERQGVMLTGMSVSTSDGGDASGQGRRPREDGARQAQVTALAPLSTDVTANPRVSQGRALDLFV